MSDTSLWGWAPYRKGGPWHAYRDNRMAWCGLQDMAMERPVSEPAGRRCRNCVDALERGTPYRRHGVTKHRSPRSTEPHVTDHPCACDDCRKRRQDQARDHAAGVLDTLPGCVCVRRWPDSAEYVDGPTARWAGLLLAWEVTGDQVTARDVEEAARTLRDAWSEAAEAYEDADGSHPYQERRR